MKYDVVAVVWNDAFEFEESELDSDSFELSPTFQCGLLIDEDDEKIRLAHSYSIDHDEHDFIVIPKAIIVNRKKLGEFDSKTKKITLFNNI
jgi:hypothetical protein